jgi:hypothetical protein
VVRPASQFSPSGKRLGSEERPTAPVWKSSDVVRQSILNGIYFVCAGPAGQPSLEHSPPFELAPRFHHGGVAVILRGAIGADDSICYGVGDSVARGGDGRPDKIET